MAYGLIDGWLYGLDEGKNEPSNEDRATDGLDGRMN